MLRLEVLGASCSVHRTGHASNPLNIGEPSSAVNPRSRRSSAVRSQPDDVMVLAPFAEDEQLTANRIGPRQHATLIRGAHVVHVDAAALHEPRGFALRR